MTRSVCALLVCLLLGGCGSKLQVEIRNFEVTKVPKSYGGASYEGRAEVAVTGSAYRQSPLLLYLKEREMVGKSESGQRVKESETQVLIVDGTGVIKTRYYDSGDDSETAGQKPTYEWTPVGFIPLQSAEVTRR